MAKNCALYVAKNCAVLLAEKCALYITTHSIMVAVTDKHLHIILLDLMVKFGSV